MPSTVPYPPFFSICIPQWERLAFLLAALDSVCAQTFRDFEVCVSDDRSPSGGQERIVAHLAAASVPFVVSVRRTNGRYDANLRDAISLSSGRYVLLLGNDDALKDARTLERYAALLRAYPDTGAVFANYESFGDGRINRTTRRTANRGRGPAVAASNYRNFAFVSGVVLYGNAARQLATDAHDGSEMYQVFLACRIVAAGKALLAIDDVMIRKDIAIAGDAVESYVTNTAKVDPRIVEKRLPVGRLGQVVVAAIAPYVPESDRGALIRKVFFQLYVFVFGFWFVEYRRVNSWRFALGVILGVRPRRSLSPLAPDLITRLSLGALFVAVASAGILMPIKLFGQLRPTLYKLAKRA